MGKWVALTVFFISIVMLVKTIIENDLPFILIFFVLSIINAYTVSELLRAHKKENEIE